LVQDVRLNECETQKPQRLRHDQLPLLDSSDY
jgi:hypothetical protein